MSLSSRNPDAVREDELQYGAVGMTREDMDRKYPNRPRNHSKTLPFHDLFIRLFNPLNENKKQPARGKPLRGPDHGSSPQEQRRRVIVSFIARWRSKVGDDFYPALRLILPDKDRDRGVYGLKENAIGKLVVKLTKIDKNSDDGYGLLHWRIPGQTAAARLAGDFAGRCFEVLSKRPMRTEVGDMTVAEVNAQLDKLAAASGETESLAVFETLYARMNAEELMWLIRIVLKQLKVGASEKTMLHAWHPDGETLFNVSSSLQRVCWELHDPSVRLEREEAGVGLMQCFQPQLAQFQMPASFQKMVELLRPTEDDAEFWIEEKLDGERMQMHVVEDASHPGGWRFRFWSRKAKDYTYLYGDGLLDDGSSLTRHLKKALAPGVRNLIVDGEMITWDMDLDKIVPFGTLKTAAISEQKKPKTDDGDGGGNDGGHRPLFRVFDILYLNHKQLTQYTLRDRRRALEKAIQTVHRRLEIHQVTRATTADAIEPLLREVVANASEGLVLKNPRSMYRLNSRNDDWLKVKPEYMSEFGESLDCLVIGGYYGSGRRGGMLSSFLCGLRVTANHVRAGADPEKCFSFFRVGGGFSADDYAEIRHRTDGKWKAWDAARPPSEYIELAGGDKRQIERPDMWIRPGESVVVSVKATSVGPSDSFARGVTLRFPRFRRLRLDRSWDSALTVDEFEELRQKVDQESHEKAMTVEDTKRRKPKRVKRELVIAGDEGAPPPAAAEFSSIRPTGIFQRLEFSVLSDSPRPYKKTKAQLEAVIKEHGGSISQRATALSRTVLVADKKTVKVASLIKAGAVDVIRPIWIRDCLEPGDGGGVPELLPYEEKHLLHVTDGTRAAAAKNTDRFGDSFARSVSVEELKRLTDAMTVDVDDEDEAVAGLLAELEQRNSGVSNMRAFIMARCLVRLLAADESDVTSKRAVDRLARYIGYAGGRCVGDDEVDAATHVVLVGGEDVDKVRQLADEVRRRWTEGGKRLARVVSGRWIEECWREKTLLDEERYAV
ncbi:DNA ligase I, ATP-dependent family protein [Ophiocordyceps camponoti-floridani]|uniref:DNA ligase n=1 Tax=Ophiocordyceps camponoti-floridani TaxID=2030778 RepID=A0A8H4Q2C7_9HYPO|nr:DNA ligase I, ATP-dependent family protein [Ophiocordyceps camponoti-floridani]